MNKEGRLSKTTSGSKYGSFFFSLLVFSILLVSILISAGCTNKTSSVGKETSSELLWRCSKVECVTYITGEDWAKEYCRFNGSATVCPIILQGQKFIVPVEDIANLTEQQVCTKYKCVEETSYRVVDYELNET